ncbi:MAG: GHMP kinase [Chloroflexi bacterium]|nr:GHMP kinase [Chloroflexota bacterium]
MLIVRAPLRISFAGGGTDLPAYYEHYGGAVISTTIDKYFYVVVEADGIRSLQVTSADYHTFYHHLSPGEIPWEDGDLRLPRAILHHFGIRHGLSLFLASEIPGGTGLGSSSTVAVALVKAMSVLCGIALTPGEIAEIASFIELRKLGAPIGKQDQYAAAFGGLRFYRFESGGVTVEPLILPLDVRIALEERLCLFFTGGSREANRILRQQQAGTVSGQNLESLHAMRAMAEQARQALGTGNLDDLAALLHEGWMYKQHLAPDISNSRLDDLYELARRHGARGGKLAGAGGGGFFLFYCEPEDQPRLTQVLQEEGLKRMDFRFSDMGAEVLINSGRRLRQLSRRDLGEILVTA